MYASGKYARAMCDICGFEVDYKSLRKQWDGFMACRGCFDTRHPQDFPRVVRTDPEVLRDPRPDNDNEPTTILAGQVKMVDGTYINEIVVHGHVGTVTVTIT